MNIKDLSSQLANRINQAHVIESTLKKVYEQGLKTGAENERKRREEENEMDCPHCKSSDTGVVSSEFEYYCEGCGEHFETDN